MEAREVGIAAASAGQTSRAVNDPLAAGKVVFENNCLSCHQATGQGVPGVFPPVVGSEWVTGSPETRARILLHGLTGPVQVAGATYNGALPAWKDVLRDEEIAALATYIRQLRPNDAAAVAAQLITDIRKREGSRTKMWTAAELQNAPAQSAPDSLPTTTTGTRND
jgi:mono/diheme cytochrome c family protein